VARQGGLGRGLGPHPPARQSSQSARGSGYHDLPIDAIRPNPYQPADVRRGVHWLPFADSIREWDCSAVLVRPAGDGYELTPGAPLARVQARRFARSRRWSARPTTTPAREALVENVQREELNPAREARVPAVDRDFGLTHEQVAGASRRAARRSRTCSGCAASTGDPGAVREHRSQWARARLARHADARSKRDCASGSSRRAVVRSSKNFGAPATTEPPKEGSDRRTADAPAACSSSRSAEAITGYAGEDPAGAGGRRDDRRSFGGLQDLERIYRRITDAKPRRRCRTARPRSR